MKIIRSTRRRGYIEVSVHEHGPGEDLGGVKKIFNEENKTLGAESEDAIPPPNTHVGRRGTAICYQELLPESGTRI